MINPTEADIGRRVRKNYRHRDGTVTQEDGTIVGVTPATVFVRFDGCEGDGAGCNREVLEWLEGGDRVPCPACGGTGLVEALAVEQEMSDG